MNSSNSGSADSAAVEASLALIGATPIENSVLGDTEIT